MTGARVDLYFLRGIRASEQTNFTLTHKYHGAYLLDFIMHRCEVLTGRVESVFSRSAPNHRKLTDHIFTATERSSRFL